MVYLTRKCEFSASHYYHNPEFTAEENQRVFGKCANLNGHGHNYTLEVTVKGEVDPKTGFVVDLKELKEILNREVLEALDHRHLNKEVPEFFHQIPTTENLAIAIWHRLQNKLNVAKLHRVRVYELPDLLVEFYGEARKPISRGATSFPHRTGCTMTECRRRRIVPSMASAITRMDTDTIMRCKSR